MKPNSQMTINFVRRLAVLGVVFLLGLSANSGLFAAQCGGLPKGWKPAEIQAVTTDSDVTDIGNSQRPTAPAPAPCKCTGASCSPAAPSPAPERGVVSVVQVEAILGRSPIVKSVRATSEFSNAVNSTLRYEVVLGVFRPPCGI